MLKHKLRQYEKILGGKCTWSRRFINHIITEQRKHARLTGGKKVPTLIELVVVKYLSKFLNENFCHL